MILEFDTISHKILTQCNKLIRTLIVLQNMYYLGSPYDWPGTALRELQWTRQFRVSYEINDACFFKTKVWRNKSALIVQQIVFPYYDKIQELF